MPYLLDTNVLLRIAQPNHPMNRQARDCVRLLLRRKETIHLVPQVMFEFWVVATRPIANNGLGMTPDTVRRKLEKAESFFELLPDTAAIYREWLRLVQTYSVAGVAAHDARICRSHEGTCGTASCNVQRRGFQTVQQNGNYRTDTRVATERPRNFELRTALSSSLRLASHQRLLAVNNLRTSAFGFLLFCPFQDFSFLLQR